MEWQPGKNHESHEEHEGHEEETLVRLDPEYRCGDHSTEVLFFVLFVCFVCFVVFDYYRLH